MPKLGTTGVKTLKSFHLILIMMWTIGVFAMSVLFLLKPKSGEELYTTLNIVLFIDNVFVMPGAILTVVTGIIYGQFTNWGFFKHRWIIIKWIVALIIILVGTFYFHPHLIESIENANQMRDTSSDNFSFISNINKNTYLSFMQGIALIALVFISVFKPWKKKKQV